MKKEDEFTAGFLRWMLGWVVAVMAVIAVLAVAGCSSPTVSEPKYPEYDKWWTQSVNTNSFEGLGQGDVYVREFVTTNLMLSADGLRREVVTNRTEAVLL